MAKSPTGWTINPLAPTANVINYDSAIMPYDKSTQPYDGFPDNTPSPTSWKNPTAYTPLSELYQQYYGGSVTHVPLWAAPSHWVYNPGIINQSGIYVPTQGAEADLDIYDNTTDSYDGSNANVSPNYDSTNNGMSFASWKTPTDWTPITGGSF